MPFDFDKECLSAFLRLKEALISTLVSQALVWEQPFEVTCNASGYALGVVMGQRRDKNPYAINYASWALDEAQVNYATIVNEFLAVDFALEKFRSYSTNSKVIIFTFRVVIKHLLKKFNCKPCPIH